ncbi:MAG: transposase, partial [Nitrosopumilaceae archaeon]|nr:transposase [Nitrosopumilaceae archaeon]
RYRTKRRASKYALKCSLPPRVIDNYTLKLPVFGTIRACMPDQVLENEPRSYEFVPNRRGGYMLYVSCRVEVPAPRAAGMTCKGIDRGSAEPTVVATVSPDGRPLAADSYDTVSAFRENRAWNQKMRSRASKMNKRSNRYRRHLQRLNQKMRKVLNKRTYAECIAAKHIVCDGRPGSVVFEKLRLSRMTSKGGAHKRSMNREMRFVRHHIIEQRIRNRAEVEGVQLLYVDPRYTSQTCSRCGHADKKSRVTRDMFKCTACNYIQQADVNAAIVIGRRGLPSSDHAIAVPPEAGTPFVRRQLDARRGIFAGPNGTRESPLKAGRRKTSEDAIRGRRVMNSHRFLITPTTSQRRGGRASYSTTSSAMKYARSAPSGPRRS